MNKKRIKNHQKKSKKHTEKLTKRARNVTKKRPTREGKGGIQDGILLEKKRILQKPDLLRGKGACWKGKAQTLPSSTRPCGGPREGYTQTLPRSTRPCGGPQAARGRISVACGNSSAPGPKEDNLHAKNLQEI